MAKTVQHKIVYETLRNEILTGVYPVGTLIPSELSMVERFKITRPTLRLALAKLINEGLIITQHGRGSEVKSQKLGLGILSVQGTTAAAGNNTALKTKIVVKPQYRLWDENFYFPLSVPEKNAGCVYMERQRLVNNEIVVFEITYLPNIKIKDFCEIELENKSLFDTLRKTYQIEVKGGEQKIWAINPSKEIAEKLNVKTDTPILHLQRKMATNKLDFNIYSILYCNTSNHHIEGIF